MWASTAVKSSWGHMAGLFTQHWKDSKNKELALEQLGLFPSHILPCQGGGGDGVSLMGAVVQYLNLIKIKPLLSFPKKTPLADIGLPVSFPFLGSMRLWVPRMGEGGPNIHLCVCWLSTLSNRW